jgi:Ca2+-binding RTX toxin-like protein
MAVNSTASDPNNGFSAALYRTVTARVFGNNPLAAQGVQYDATGKTQTIESVNTSNSPVSLFEEVYGNPAFYPPNLAAGAIPGNSVSPVPTDIPTMTLTSNGHSDLIQLATGSGIDLTLMGSAGDPGDIVYGDSGKDTITTTSGNNLVIGGTGLSTLQGGSGHDTLWGGTGATALVQGGSGNDQRLEGGLSPLDVGTTDDTLVAGSGQDDTLWAAYNDVVENGTAATGKETLISGVTGKDTMTGNGSTYYEIRGLAKVVIHAGQTASSSDTITANSGTDGSAVAGGPEQITTTAGHNFITLGSGYSTLSAGGDDSISLINGGFDTVDASQGADTIRIGAAPAGSDSITGNASTEVYFSSGLTPTSVVPPATNPSTTGGVTTITFTQGSVVVLNGVSQNNIHFLSPSGNPDSNNF